MKKFLCILLTLSLLLSATALADPIQSIQSILPTKQETGQHTIDRRDLPVYIGDMDSVIDSMPFYFLDGAEDLPYMTLTDWNDLKTTFMHTYWNDTKFEVTLEEKEPGVFYVERENGYYMEMDFNADTIYFNDYNAFLHSSLDTSLLDVLSYTGFNDEGEAELFQRNAQASFDRYGEDILLELANYKIDLVYQDGVGYIPLQTLGDLLLAPQNRMCTFFNGKAVILGNERCFFSSQTGYTPLGEYLYSAEPTQRSQALAEYGFHELCLALDTLYGLKKNHEISSFAQLFWQVGFDEALTSTDPQEADTAVLNLIDMYLDDLHTEFGLYSWMAGAQNVPDPFGPSDTRYSQQAERYSKLREDAQGEDWYSYQEVDDTAYIAFDRFVTGNSASYYAAETLDDMPDDTISLMIYAYDRIYRKDSPIKNVVFDLSNNMGGDLDAGLYVMAFVLGNAELSVKDTFTGAQSTMVYRADVNLDRQFDRLDTLDDMNVYCLISPVSFSCGNLVPAAFKASQMVTILGRTSGGGCCSLQPMSTAWGTCFQISGTNMLSFRKNGAFYDIDQGVEPDYYIDNPADFYDREKLTRFIKSLSDY